MICQLTDYITKFDTCCMVRVVNYRWSKAINLNWRSFILVIKINKIIEVLVALVFSLVHYSFPSYSGLVSQLLVVINIHKNKVYFIRFKHAFAETSFSSADLQQAEDRQDQHVNLIILQHRFHSVLAVIYLFNKVKNKCQNNEIWHICLCHWRTIFIFNDNKDIRKFVCCTSR